jgi:hypothetical protein
VGQHPSAFRLALAHERRERLAAGERRPQLVVLEKRHVARGFELSGGHEAFANLDQHPANESAREPFGIDDVVVALGVDGLGVGEGAIEAFAIGARQARAGFLDRSLAPPLRFSRRGFATE